MAKIRLDEIDTRAPKDFDKDAIKEKTARIKLKMEELQNLLIAERKHSLLVILQGMDASGKDGAIKNVFNTINPMGTRVYSFKQPTEIEAQHDFLWRVHSKVPELGMIHIFNRSHYEDVLIQKVHHFVDEKAIKARYDHINNFEKLLKDAGTVVLKFYLHISRDRQLERLQERLSDKTKMWKYNENDLKEREYWDDYREAYEQAFDHCSEEADWIIVPADQNWYKEYLIAGKVVAALESFNMQYPGLKPE